MPAVFDGSFDRPESLLKGLSFATKLIIPKLLLVLVIILLINSNICTASF